MLRTGVPWGVHVLARAAAAAGKSGAWDGVPATYGEGQHNSKVVGASGRLRGLPYCFNASSARAVPRATCVMLRPS